MDININLTVRLPLDQLSQLLDTITNAGAAKSTEANSIKKPAQTVAKVTTEDKKTEPANESTSVLRVTLEQLRVAGQQKSKAGKKSELKAILDQFGVKNITELPEDKYAECLTKINAIA